MGPGAQHRCGHDWADARSGEQLRPPGPDQGGDGPGVLGGLVVQELDAAGQGEQAGRGGGGLGVPVAALTQPPAGGDKLGSSQVPQATAEGFWGGGDQRVELSLGVAGGLDRGAAGRQPDLRCPAARG
jgi:hypothetical protein